MREPVGVGLIGTGHWGTKLLDEYLSAERKGLVRLVKVCDNSRDALSRCREKFSLGQEQLTGKVEDAMSHPRVSAVHIATPNSSHYALARMGLEAGKNVLVEKPMTLNPREAFDLVDFASSHGLVLHVGQIFRHNSALDAARRALDASIIGKIHYVKVQWKNLERPDGERDIIFDLGPHPFDVLNKLLDSWPIQVNGFARGFRSTNDEVAYVEAEYQNGVFAHVELSWLHPKKAREVTLVGSVGALAVDCLNQTIAYYRNGDTERIPVSPNNTIETEINCFVDCITRADTSTESSLLGAKTVELLDKVRSSVWHGPSQIVETHRPQIAPETITVS